MIKIKYNNDDISTDIKANLFILLIIGVIVLTIYLKSWVFFIGGSIFLIVIKLIIERPDGEFSVSRIGNRIVLCDSNEVQQEEFEIANIYLSWNYIHYSMSNQHDDSVSKPTHSNTILLKLELVLTNGKIILIHESLYPWQEIPQGINYKVLDEEHVQKKVIINGKLMKKKDELETYDLLSNFL